MRLSATIASLVLALLGSVLVAPTAHASETRRTNTRFDAETDGFAVASATVRFPSRRSFDVRGWVKDMCGGDPDGDGRGAYARVAWTVRGHTGVSPQRRLGRDVNGCGNGKRRFDPAPRIFERKVLSVSLVVCEADADDPDSGMCRLTSFDNWRVD